MKLTDKDILLVKLAVSILIVFFMVRFLIMPGIGRYQENRIEGKELEDRVEEIQTAVDSIPVLEQTIAEQRKELDKVSEVYYGRLENRQIDELLTGIAINAGLFPVHYRGRCDRGIWKQPELPYSHAQGCHCGGGEGAGRGIRVKCPVKS